MSSSISLDGDFNGDGVVNVLDLSIVASALHSYPGHPEWNSAYDLNGDCIIDIIDFVLVAKEFGNCEHCAVWDDQWGVFVTEYMMGYERFTATQVDVLSNIGITSLCLMLEKNDWDTAGFKDYLQSLVSYSKQKGLYTIVMLKSKDHQAHGWYVFGSQQKITEWISWGVEVIQYCDPDAIHIMDEPTGYIKPDGYRISFTQYYTNFLIPSYSAYTTADPDITVYIVSCPWYDLYHLETVTLPANTMIQWHVFYGPHIGDAYNDYLAGQFSSAKTKLYSFLDSRIGNLPRDRIVLGAGANRDPYNTEPNWQVFMHDIYDYCLTNGIGEYWQFAVGVNNWNLLDKRTGYTTLTVTGQYFRNYIIG